MFLFVVILSFLNITITPMERKKCKQFVIQIIWNSENIFCPLPVEKCFNYFFCSTDNIFRKLISKKKNNLKNLIPVTRFDNTCLLKSSQWVQWHSKNNFECHYTNWSFYTFMYLFKFVAPQNEEGKSCIIFNSY